MSRETRRTGPNNSAGPVVNSLGTRPRSRKLDDVQAVRSVMWRGPRRPQFNRYEEDCDMSRAIRRDNELSDACVGVCTGEGIEAIRERVARDLSGHVLWREISS